ncbi:MAG: TerB family tellurite resistance protein [Deltaproteobacteria bacterium]|nr:TerB family tellurite resistance protein [Deltaproteobacteria bacterium]
MFENLKDLLSHSTLTVDASGQPTSRDLRISVVVLLLSLANADGNLSSPEVGALCTSTFRKMGLEEHETGELMEVADFLVRDSAKLDSFLAALRDGFNSNQKQLLLALLWRIIMADQKVEKLEGIMAAEIRTKLGLSLEQGVRARKLAEVEELDVILERFP